jgi:hypothetical protein
MDHNRVKTLSVDMMENWGNRPRWMVEVPKYWSEAFIYEEIVLNENETVYFAVSGVLVSYFHHNKRNQRGFGGRTFNLRLTNGLRANVTGPWSSRAGAINKVVHPYKHCTDVIINGNYAGSMLSSQLVILARKQEIPIVYLEMWEECTIEPCWPNGDVKDFDENSMKVRELPEYLQFIHDHL